MNRELTQEELRDFLASNYMGHLACCEDNVPYVVPITYYYDQDSDSIISYTAEGRKVDMLRKNPRVCLEVSEIKDLSNWKSVILEGEFEEIQGVEALEAIRMLVTRLLKLVNDSGLQQVEEIRDISRANEDRPKVIYRIRLSKKSGRLETNR